MVQSWPAQRHILPSLGSVGDCYDNAAMESFFSTLKRECVNRSHFVTRRMAKTVIFEYLEVFYSRQRLYLSPAEYEQQHPIP
ncbi:MAG: IS3 family transposase [Anaerolineae bacterium]